VLKPKFAAVIVSGVAVAALAGMGSGLVPIASGPAAAAASGVTATDTATACSIGAVARRDLPSVVTITARSGKSGSTGSGEVIDHAGHVLTNNHVVAGAAGSNGEISVLFADGRSLPATIAGRDPATDLAVLTLSGNAGVPPIPMAPSKSHLEVGDTVVVLGAPLGLSGTVTSGIVSALGRTITVPAADRRSALLVNAIQTDAAINPGNSGGALVNCAAELVGVPSAGATVPLASGGRSAGSIGLGFAIPVEMAKTIAAELITSGRAHHSELGLEASPARTPNSTVKGLYVDAVVPGGPAALSGLRTGDLITRIDGTPATSSDQLNALELTRAAGSNVVFAYDRDGQPANTTVTLRNAP
jgi:putative serine protease PepD